MKFLTRSAVIGFFASLLALAGCAGVFSKPHDPTSSVVLVTGITGTQGGAVATALLEQGYQVRGLTRDPTSDASQGWSDKGVEMVKGDFADYDSIKAAVAGADYIFVNILQNIPNFVELGKHTFDAANESGVKHIVFTSARLYEPESGFPVEQGATRRALELYLRDSGYSFTTLRIPQMMENFLRERDLQQFAGQGVVSAGLETSLNHYFSMYDMGRVTAGTFANPKKWNGRELNLSSSALTDREVADLVSQLSGVDVKYSTISWDEATNPNARNFRYMEENNLSYDNEELEREFPGLIGLEEFLIANEFGDMLKNTEAPTEPVADDRRRGGGGAGGGRNADRERDQNRERGQNRERNNDS